MITYKGYQIVQSLYNNEFYVMCGGINIATAYSMDQAKYIIDELS